MLKHNAHHVCQLHNMPETIQYYLETFILYKISVRSTNVSFLFVIQGLLIFPHVILFGYTYINHLLKHLAVVVGCEHQMINHISLLCFLLTTLLFMMFQQKIIWLKEPNI